jgi:hypothetical protein
MGADSLRIQLRSDIVYLTKKYKPCLFGSNAHQVVKHGGVFDCSAYPNLAKGRLSLVCTIQDVLVLAAWIV